jgi:16S rRNA (adenine1518-N6/adenine1519-N6)-dimethyltransferase
VEIGPGTGILTRRIGPLVAHLYAVEIDRKLARYLELSMADYGSVSVVHADFLKTDPGEWAREKKIRIVGNIPYHITSPILFKILELRKRVIDLTLLIQREVAQRIIAGPNSRIYGILSVFSQTFADVAVLLNVPKTVFRPRPKVDSSLVRWTFTSERSQTLSDEKLFREVVRMAFGQRRKMLRNSLKTVMPPTINPEVQLKRPEQLSVREWIALVNKMSG